MRAAAEQLATMLAPGAAIQPSGEFIQLAHPGVALPEAKSAIDVEASRHLGDAGSPDGAARAAEMLGPPRVALLQKGIVPTAPPPPRGPAFRQAAPSKPQITAPLQRLDAHRTTTLPDPVAAPTWIAPPMVAPGGTPAAVAEAVLDRPAERLQPAGTVASWTSFQKALFATPSVVTDPGG